MNNMNAGTGMPKRSMVPVVPRPPMNPNTSGPTAQGHMDNFNADNGAVGANAMANPTANSGTTIGNALTQLYNTQPGEATLAGGQFPPGAPQVSGNRSLVGPSLQNSGGNAAADSVQRLGYANQPGMTPPSNGAAVNGNGNLGSVLQFLAPKAQKMHKLASQPQPPLNLGLTFPQSNQGGGLR